MKEQTVWELPVDAVELTTKHVVGRVYRDGLFIAFERSGTPHDELGKHGTVMKTIHGLHLRLSSESPSQGMATYGKLLNKAIFDECLCGDTVWTTEEPCFTRMRLPFANIMEYMSVWPLAAIHAEDGSMAIQAKNFNRFEFALPQLNIKGWVQFTYAWSSKTFVEQKFTAQSALVLDYDAPVPLATIKEHEEWLQSFFDYIWFRGHRSGMFYLHNGEGLAMLYRRESISPEVSAAHSMDLQDILTRKNLTEWIERWFTLSEAQRMAVEPVLSIARNPGIITDVKFIMAIHALDALLQDRRRKTAKDSDMSARFLHHLGPWWQHKARKGEALKHYIDRVVWTRNDIVKAVRHLKASTAILLTPLERASAYFELLLLHRALFLELMRVDRSRIDRFVEDGLRKIAAQEFR